MNGVCLNTAKRKCSLKLWSSSANDHTLAPIAGVIEQLNAILAPELKDPVTFDIIDPSTPVSSPACSPFSLAPLVGGAKAKDQRSQPKGPVEPSVPPPAEAASTPAQCENESA